MKKLTVLFLVILWCVLTHSELSFQYAQRGLELWFERMVPALLPFMILSGTMVRLQLTEKVAMLVHPVLHPIYRIQKNASYVVLMGFLCGFPMGAKVIADLYTTNRLSRTEAEYLLSFCNNIGPAYFCGFVLPLLEMESTLPYLCGMYAIPLLYGLLLRYTFYRNHLSVRANSYVLAACENPSHNVKVAEKPLVHRLLEALDGAVFTAVQSILSLGGYMIIFNLLNLLPHIFCSGEFLLVGPLLEVTGGIYALSGSSPLYSLLALSYGGLSCIAQTYSCISRTDLSISVYCIHKVILTLLTGIYYFVWYLLFPESFMI